MGCYSFTDGDFRGTVTAFGTPCTLAGWIKYTDHPDANRDAILAMINFGTYNGSCRISTSPGTDPYVASHINDDNTGGAYATYTASDGEYDGEWLPIVAVFTSASSRTIYVGDIANTATDTANIVNFSANMDLLCIGRPDAGFRPWTGKIGHVAYWGVALSTGDITAFLAGTPPSAINSANLIAYYSLSTNDDTPSDEGPNGGPTLTKSGTATYDGADSPPVGIEDMTATGAQALTGGAVITGGAGAPTFDSAPSMQSQTTSAYTVAYNASASAANIYCGAWARNATAPTAAQIEAGTGARGTATQAASGADQTIVITPTDSPKFPQYDLYFVLKSSGGVYSNVASLPGEYLDIPAGKQRVTAAGTLVGVFGAGTGRAVGDISYIDSASQPSDYLVTVDPDGSYALQTGSDESRQKFYTDSYDLSGVAWLEQVEQWINNYAPTPNPSFPTPVEISLLVGVAVVINLTGYALDQEGDALTVALQSGSNPTGTGISTPNLTGTPTTPGIYRPVYRFTDITGATLDRAFAIPVRALRPLFEGTVQDEFFSLSELITPINYGTDFDHDSGSMSGVTFELKQLGSSAIETTVAGASEQSHALAVVSASTISVGEYVSVESNPSELALVLAKYGNELELATALASADGDDVRVYTVGNGIVSGLTLASGTGILTGTPDTLGTESNLFVRGIDGANQIADTPMFSIDVAIGESAGPYILLPGEVIATIQYPSVTTLEL